MDSHTDAELMGGLAVANGECSTLTSRFPKICLGQMVAMISGLYKSRISRGVIKVCMICICASMSITDCCNVLTE